MEIMRQQVKRIKRNPDALTYFRQVADNLTKHLPQKAWIAEIRALHNFVRDEIRYLRDVNGIETVQYPEFVLRNRTGDCDDKATLLATLLEAIGHPARFRAVGFRPGVLEHVLVDTQVGKGRNKKWLPLETTENVDIGWQPPNIRHQMIRHL